MGTSAHQQEPGVAAVVRRSTSGYTRSWIGRSKGTGLLWIDATYVKAREAGRIISVAVIIAISVNTDGVREVPGMSVDPSSDLVPWQRDYDRFKRRPARHWSVS
jgi:hypothetical protein